PTSVQPTSVQPTSVPPTSEPPTSVPTPPTSVPPTSEPPTSVPPTSVPPTSVQPTSVPPTSEPPTSVPTPPTSVPPTSAPPVTSPPPVTTDTITQTTNTDPVTTQTDLPTTTEVVPTTESVLIPTTTDSITETIAPPTSFSVTNISGTIVTIGPGGTPLPGAGGGSGSMGPDGATSKAGLSGGGIAGVVIGSLALLALIGGIFFIMFRRQSRRLENPNGRFVSRAGAGAAATGDLGHLYGSRQPEGSGSNSYGSARNLPGGAPTAGHIVVAPEMMEHPANRSNLNLHSGPMAFGTAAGSSGLAGVHSPDGYHESLSDGRDQTSSSYGASGGSGPAVSGSHSASGLNPFGTPSGSQIQSSPSGGSGSPQSQKGSIHYI
ncbi:hypothetical protein BGZ93_001552, partial [Podila epicladia]